LEEKKGHGSAVLSSSSEVAVASNLHPTTTTLKERKRPVSYKNAILSSSIERPFPMCRYNKGEY
jgi:hypothetical protein